MWVINPAGVLHWVFSRLWVQHLMTIFKGSVVFFLGKKYVCFFLQIQILTFFMRRNYKYSAKTT